MTKHYIYLFSLSLLYLKDSKWGSAALLFPELMNIVLILFYNLVVFIILLYTFLVTLFFETFCLICVTSFSKFSDVLPAFTCASAIGNLWSICLGVNILNPFPYSSFIGNIPPLKALKANSQPLYRAYAISWVSVFYPYFLYFLV